MTEGGVVIDIEELASSIENNISDDLYMPKECCIFKTPKILSRHNQKAYIPNAFSIGPFHHRDQNLKQTEKIKFKYLKNLLSRAQSPETRLRDFIKEISEIEKEARGYYAGLRDYDDSKEFVKMLVIDGCFLIQLFRRDAERQLIEQPPQKEDDHDPVFSMSCIPQFLYHDLILLENQIPWIVLEKLFNMTKEDCNDSKSLVRLAIEFFSNMFSSAPTNIDEGLITRNKTRHILDLLRNWLISPLCQERKIQDSAWQTFPSATEIKEAGIKFKKLEKAKSILDIRFQNGVLEIPNLLIQETTETIFRNLISLEQCCPDYQPIITCYAIVLDNLINTTEDVRILSKKEIIDCWLNPGDATQFFSKLYLDAFVKKFYYLDLCQDVNEYRKKRCPKWRAAYVHNYFGTPWAIASQVVAAVVLILTFLQTLFSIIK
ncbi:hypothetical protein JCGZ_10144 [Jatropha curcas]|nr:hypothetical protein JCGZ_10144 [Jatropha curcas]